MRNGIKTLAAIIVIVAAMLFLYRMATKFFPVSVPLKRRKGVGDFGAYRSAHPTVPHQGQDFLVKPGQEIYAPISGKIRIAKPYASDNRFSGVEITGENYRVKVFYISPILENGEKIKSGQLLGYAQDLSIKYGKGFLSQNHVHVEVRKTGQTKAIDPDPYFPKDSDLIAVFA